MSSASLSGQNRNDDVPLICHSHGEVLAQLIAGSWIGWGRVTPEDVPYPDGLVA